MALEITSVLQNSLGIIKVLGIFALVIFAIAGVGIAFWYLKSFGVHVVILADRAGTQNNWKIFFDKGGYFKKRQGAFQEFKLQRDKAKLSPPDPKYLMMAEGGRNVLFLNKVGLNEYVPILPHSINQIGNPAVALNLVGEDQDIARWASLQQWENRQTFQHKSFIEQALPIIAITVTAVFILLLIYVLLQKFDVLSSTANALERAASALRNVNVAPTTPAEAPY